MASRSSVARNASGNFLRILLTGPTGQVGFELQHTLSSLGDVVSVDRRRLELTKPDLIRETMRAIKPNLIINAAAYNAVDRAEEEPDLAMAVNGAAAGIFAEEAKRLGDALVHYSTDYVFDGSGERSWREDDEPRPLNVYGQSKLAGESAIQAVDVPYLILRTSWVYGRHGNNFVKTMLRLGSERREISVVADQVGAPTSARVIADVTGQILAQAKGHVVDLLDKLGGVVHLTCQGETSWYGFAREIFRLARLKRFPLAVQALVPISSEDYPRPAKRPKNSRLSCEQLQARFSLRPPTWEVALHRFFGELVSTNY